MVDRLLPDCSVESVKHDLKTLLAGFGLYPKEAEAMVKTWEDSGSRRASGCCMSLPRQRTDAILPLEITPKPNKLVRVLVGRMEIMTREDTEQMFELLTRLKSAQGPKRRRFPSLGSAMAGSAPMIWSVLEKQRSLWDPALARPLRSLGVPVH